MSKKITYIHAENNNKILSSNEVRLYVPPEPEKMKVLIWGKELCNGAEWYDFLKCVEEKTKENDKLKQQLEQANEIINNPNTLIAQQQELIESLNKQLDERGKQLADKQNTIDEINKEFVQAVHDWKALCAEKDKELAYMTKQAKKFNNEAQKYYEDAYCNNFQNQKAIAELEKVKEKISKLPITDILDTDYGGFKKIYQTDAMSIIDRQIKELKGE